MSNRETETLSEIENEIRSSLMTISSAELADRIHAAAERERAYWKDRIQACIDVSDAFKKELDHVLDLICYQQHMSSPKSANGK